MIEVVVLEGEGKDLVGKFQFETLPQRGEEITVAWPADPCGVRIFDVYGVAHAAAGVGGDTPVTSLLVNEIG